MGWPCLHLVRRRTRWSDDGRNSSAVRSGDTNNPGRLRPCCLMSPGSSSGRLYLILQPTPEEVFEPDSVADAPLVRFIAYGLQERVFGWVRLRADRLTDLLN